MTNREALIGHITLCTTRELAEQFVHAVFNQYEEIDHYRGHFDGVYPLREDAIQAEIDWLESQYIEDSEGGTYKMQL